MIIDDNIVILNKKIVSVLISFFIILTALTGQKSDSMLEVISSRFSEYCRSVPREEIYVHTDRDDYIAGETTWFSMYLVDRQSNMPSGMSDIAYFELLNHENKPVIRRRIKIENSFGSGGINIPDTLQSGIYYLRAYTNWMKNFLPYGCFYKEININSALEPGNTRDRSAMEAGIQERLMTAAGNPSKPSPVSITTETGGSGQLRVLIAADQDFVNRNSSGCYLFIHTHGVRNFASKVILAGQVTDLSVPRDLLIPGINHITLFSADGEAVSEKFIYTPRNTENSASVICSDSVPLRSRFVMEASILQDKPGLNEMARLSVSVTPETDFSSFEDIDDYMVLGSEFEPVPGGMKYSKLDSLSHYELETFLSSLKSNWIDWNTIMSGKIPDFKYQPEKGVNYIYGSLVNETTLMPDPGQYLFLSIPGKKAYFQYAVTDNNGRFRFEIPITEQRRELIIQPEYIDRNNKVTIESAYSEEYIQDEEPGIRLISEVPQFISRMSANYQVDNIYGIENTGVSEVTGRNSDTPYRFYGKPDIEIKMDDYIKLPVMEEVFFELIPGTYLKNRRTGFELTVADMVDFTVYDHPPMMMIDGVIINDASIIGNLDPELVEQIDVVRMKYLVGNYLIFGIVNVITRKGDFSSETIPGYAVRLSYRSFDQVPVLTLPDYSSAGTRQSRIPDFRNTLYWNPSVRPGKDGKIRLEFWTSDQPADYTVNVQGIDGNGEFVSVKKRVRLY